jgi:arabinogalactan oligomer/maltooligosaccharide transport system substrate-binding protein
MKKILALLLATLMMVGVFAGCGETSTTTSDSNDSSASGSDSSTTTVTSTNFDDVVTSDMFGDEEGAKLKVWGPDAYAKLLKKQCAAFTEKFKDQNITITVVAQGEDTSATQIMQDPDAGADVFGLASDKLNQLYDSGVIAPVATTFANVIKETDLENAVEVSTLEDQLYAYPETGNGYYLVYDKSVVSDEQAKSLEDILAACKKANKKFIMDAGTGYYSCVFAFTGGLTIDGYESDGKTQKFNDYDEDQVVDTLKAFSTLMHKYSGTFTSLDPAKISSGFTSTSKIKSTVGAGIDGSWNSEADSKALGDNYGATKLPTIKVNGEDTQMISMYGYKMIGVNANSKYPRTAQILAYYLSSEECQQQRCDQLGWSPTNKSVADSDSATENVSIQALLDQSNYSVAQLNVAQQFWDPMANLGNKLVADDTKPDSYDFKTLLKNTVANIKDV